MDQNAIVSNAASGFLANNPYFSAGFGLLGVGAGLAVLRQSSRKLAALIRRQMLVTLEIPSKDKSYQWVLQWLSENSQQKVLQQHKLAKNQSALQQATSFETSAKSSSATESDNKVHEINEIKNETASIENSSVSGGKIGYFARRLSQATRPRQLAVQTVYKLHDNGSVSADFSFVPGPGKYIFKFEDAWIQVTRERESKMVDFTNAAPWETITLTTLNRDRNVFSKILALSQQHALEKQEGKTVIFTSVGPEWRPFGPPRKKRMLKSVVLDDGIADSIVQDVREFIGNGKWYDMRGIPYRRGYLLYGPPGTGKTSFIQALAGELGYNICVLNLNERGHTDDRLNHLLTVAPERSIILLEDIDAAFPKAPSASAAGGAEGHVLMQRDQQQQQQQGGLYQIHSMITLSGLLNALDGVSSSEERIVFMTTNHIDRLDKALIRPGRVDVKVYLGNATQSQVKKMFMRFYPEPKETSLELAEKFASKLENQQVSTAQLQGHFVTFKYDANAALDNIHLLLQKQ
ncbi:Mitochondrial chaperone BCS1 [Zancudomyces culisetae]|uniref:Mitochondrial chaperone BCS1 n=1 Tax=Zancudomyces culisetae TaxID=1213189 RepID=A0A1R1PJZ5_ZANCU|nr:Mitochondrial chaperone BCS1 [Zancudomyces culisetae]|eukprot:OMH81288.1 Mitochondrial chaperone BCS1 [Zancudomyces culisetae]